MKNAQADSCCSAACAISEGSSCAKRWFRISQRSNFAANQDTEVVSLFPLEQWLPRAACRGDFPMKMIRLTGLALVWGLAATMQAQSYKILGFFSNVPDAPAGLIAQSRGG